VECSNFSQPLKKPLFVAESMPKSVSRPTKVMMMPAMSRLRLSDIHSRLPLGRVGGGTAFFPWLVLGFEGFFTVFLLVLVLLLGGLLDFLVEVLDDLLLVMRLCPSLNCCAGRL
jgi:hypothetical protein